ncbi:MAG: carboxypeptidase-like regulatory domain-containing protein [Desulfuromonadaceae bacterium]|nr:carboxypeptidase-like regulatory domain-containing protein [Desulfuromonadaceae bacterium]
MLTTEPMKNIAIISIVIVLCSCALVDRVPEGAVVSGKLTSASQSVAASVDAYPAAVTTLRGLAPYRVATATDGTFRLHLPPGDYYLLARGEESFAYYGRNPVTVPAAGITELNVGLVSSSRDVILPLEPFATTGVAGVVTHQGVPLGGAMVFVYTDLTSQLKGMGYQIAGPTDAEGYFEAELPPGTYYLLVRLRRGAQQLGPLRAGDLYGYHADNPLTVHADQVARIGIALLEVPDKVERYAEHLFGDTSLQGQIVDVAGNPVAGMRAILYANAQMLNRPLFVSQPTGADGRFMLSFPHGGTYYLAARNTLGGAPGPGDLYGVYDGTPDHSLLIDKGQTRTDIRLVVEEMW